MSALCRKRQSHRENSCAFAVAAVTCVARSLPLRLAAVRSISSRAALSCRGRSPRVTTRRARTTSALRWRCYRAEPQRLEVQHARATTHRSAARSSLRRRRAGSANSRRGALLRRLRATRAATRVVRGLLLLPLSRARAPSRSTYAMARLLATALPADAAALRRAPLRLRTRRATRVRARSASNSVARRAYRRSAPRARTRPVACAS